MTIAKNIASPRADEDLSRAKTFDQGFDCGWKEAIEAAAMIAEVSGPADGLGPKIAEHIRSLGEKK